jgi:hypothetical protein
MKSECLCNAAIGKHSGSVDDGGGVGDQQRQAVGKPAVYVPVGKHRKFPSHSIPAMLS